MKYQKNALRNLLVLAGMTAVLSTGQAATVAAPVSGDLFLAFRATGGQGSSQSYIVNIGSDTGYRNAAPGSTFTVSGLGSIGADLVATFGGTWFSRNDLFWGIFGTRDSASSIIYGSKEQNPLGSATLPWPTLTQTARNGTSTAIVSVISGLGGYTGADATLNSPVGTVQTNSSNDSSYNKQVSASGTTDFGSLSQWNSIEGSFANGTAGTALDLYRIGGLGVSQVGTFTIDNSGALGFAAVPEPGTALFMATAGIALLMRRRVTQPRNS